MVKRTVGVKAHGVEITALGGEVYAARIINNGAADIARYIIYGIDNASGNGVYGVQHRGRAVAAARAIIGAEHRANIVHICAYPIITAHMRH